jgi:hypothetical protein
MKMILKSDLCFIFSAVIFSTAFLLFGCASSYAPERTAEAQTNQAKTPAETIQKNLEFLQGIENPCDFNNVSGTNTEFGAKKLYELIHAGFPKETSVEEAVETFNRFAKCEEKSKTQPPLTADEVLAAIRDWDCTREENKDEKKFCVEAWKISETGKMPKGSLFVYDRGMNGRSTVRGYKGYYVQTWEIILYLRLDKHRLDLRDVPEFRRSIRLKYISSETE